jgi:hypothetical protein
MPYVRCIRCGLRIYTAALWSNVEYCGNCGAQLPRPKRGPTVIAEHPRPGWVRLSERRIEPTQERAP